MEHTIIHLEPEQIAAHTPLATAALRHLKLVGYAKGRFIFTDGGDKRRFLYYFFCAARRISDLHYARPERVRGKTVWVSPLHLDGGATCTLPRA